MATTMPSGIDLQSLQLKSCYKFADHIGINMEEHTATSELKSKIIAVGLEWQIGSTSFIFPSLSPIRYPRMGLDGYLLTCINILQ